MRFALLLVPCVLACGCGELVGAEASARAASALESSGGGAWSVSVEWLSGPPAVGHVAAGKLHFSNASGAAAEHADGVSATAGLASGDGHAHALQCSHNPAGPADVWDFNDLEPNAPGDWAMHIQATVDEQKDTAEVPFSVPEAF